MYRANRFNGLVTLAIASPSKTFVVEIQLTSPNRYLNCYLTIDPFDVTVLRINANTIAVAITKFPAHEITKK